MFTLRVSPAPVAVIKKCELPVAAPDFLVRVIVDEPFPGEPMVCGLRLAVTPVGNPETEKASDELKPPKAVVVSFNAPLADALTVTLLTFGVSENPATLTLNACF